MDSIAPRVLILGGTSEARALAAELVDRDVAVTSSLAGRVAEPRLPKGDIRVGGFGGPEGLARWLADHRVVAVVDATHPFAERISSSAAVAATSADVPVLRLERPGWSQGPGDDWHWADTLADAARMLPELGTRAFLTSGRQGLAEFAGLDMWMLARCVDPPEPPLPARLEVILSRGPYRVEDEADLLRRHRIDVLVTKDSGGAMTEAKLTAAREAGIPVIVVRRPPRPAMPRVDDVKSAVRWVVPHMNGHPHDSPSGSSR
ncbi:cobalt-precorrin-6A reductase [Prauserella rugosa]|uniref:Precorrin-6A/cobalt-precorrin-6A reductase n=1 Tax=Prauserella rugosa TaxID=43354 RepID=A0A660CM91_9PSEU|nr:cobalt-precorrin-6A reductase [Prauserella rugosa]KMS92692.1 cobalt-precorrin-6X reductase [Streptomyces regensis]TWH22763.1 precorrin-6A/cobalt-precorrin-6A reductase [Prauserella rugosa]